MKRKLLIGAACLVFLVIVVFSLGRGARRRPADGNFTRAPEREHSTMTVVAELPKSNAPPAAPEVKFQ